METIAETVTLEQEYGATPEWALRLRAAIRACDHCHSWSDADIAEHELARVVIQFQKEILGVWAG